MSTTTSTAVPYAADERLSGQVRAFLKPLNEGGGAPLETLPVPDARNVLTAAQEAFPVDLSGIDTEEKVIDFDGFRITLNIVRPKDKNGILPAFLFLHGGGWVLGDFPTHKRMVRDLAVLTGFAGIFVDYQRAPEKQYPFQVNEVFAAARWVAANGSKISVDTTRLAIVGNSAGGNLAAATLLKTITSGLDIFKAAVLFWPVTDANFGRESWKAFGGERFLTAPLMKWMWDQYIPAEKRGEIFASPLQASIEELGKFPPTLIQVAENDILRDEGETFGRKLLEAGVDATTVRYNDVIHDWGLLNGLAEIPQTKALFEQAAAELRKRLQ